MIKWIVFDLDGTLLNDQKELSTKLINLVHNLQKQGINIVIASGRAVELIIPYAKQLNVTLPVISNNGSLIYSISNNKTLLKHTINPEEKRKVLETVLKRNLPFTFYAEDGFYTNDANRIKFYTTWNETHKDAYINIIQTSDLDKLMSSAAYKLLIVENNQEIFDALYKGFQSNPHIHTTKSQEAFLDVLPKNVNKGVSLSWLMNKYGIDKEEILVFGDNENDIEMFDVAGLSVAMKNASDYVKSKASLISLNDSNNDGVRETLEYFIKNGYFKNITL